MVLENASDSVPESFSEYDGTPDTVENPNSPPRVGDLTRKFKVDTENLPRPMPIFGALGGYSEKFLTQMIDVRLRASQRLLKRPITEEEATALSYWTAKQLAITSYGTPLGVAGGAARAWATRKTFRFPFYQPDLESLNTHFFPSTNRIMFMGPTAIRAWHATRLFSYVVVGQFIGQMFFASYAMSVVTVGELGDSRLEKYIKGIREAARNPSRIAAPAPPPPPRGMTRGRTPQPVDDASPAAVAFDSLDDSAPDTGALQDQGLGSQEARQRLGSRRSPTRSTASALGTAKTEPPPQPIDDYIDDASPTGGKGVAMDTESAGGSAWARIRSRSMGVGSPRGNSGSSWSSGRDSAQSTGGSSWTRGQTEPTSDDPFAFSSDDEERQLAKEEAQKVFDARVERERRGGDFSSGGDQKRW